MGWMESKHTHSALARKISSAPAEPQATHPIFPSPCWDIFTTCQLHTRRGSGLDKRQPSKGLLSSGTHIKPTLTKTHHYTSCQTQQHQGCWGWNKLLIFSSNYRDMVTQNACVKDILPRIDRTETEEPLKQSWHVLLMKFLVSAQGESIQVLHYLIHHFPPAIHHMVICQANCSFISCRS